jgi:phage major head subunit gpT-like protein
VKITPSWVATFETNQQTLIQDAWARMRPNLVWDKFMDVRQSQTGRELFFWLLETARITDEGQGGNKRFDDIAATFFEIVNKNSGAGLRLTRNEIEDNMMAGESLRGMPSLDYAASWSRQMGGSAAYWPQELLFTLLAGGKTTKGYDAVNFFATNHPINPSAGSGAGTYSNLISAKPIGSSVSLDVAASNLSDVFQAIRSLRQPNGKPRNLVPRYLLAGEDLRKRAFELLDTKTLVAGATAGATGVALAPIENVISRYGMEPVIATELSEAGVYYVSCEMLPGEGGPFIFQDRSPYVLTSYQPETQAELQRRKEFEWSFDGRNAGAYGHPYLMFRVEPT